MHFVRADPLVFCKNEEMEKAEPQEAVGHQPHLCLWLWPIVFRVVVCLVVCFMFIVVALSSALLANSHDDEACAFGRPGFDRQAREEGRRD